MKKIYFFLISFFITSLAFAQNDYATIHIYRTKAFTIACNDCVKILLNDTYLTPIDNGGHLELKIFNLKQSKLTITDGSSYKNEIMISPQKGQTYYFNAKAKFPRYLGFELAKMDIPIKDSKLDKKRFISLSDVGMTILDERNNQPDTEWTREKLISHWEQNGISDIEGIYERISAQIEYKLAVLKENNDYKIIYLAGARGTGWKEGDIKAELQKTAQFGIFKSGWYMLNKSYNKDMIITFENASMKTISETGSGYDVYLKMYPTYDESSTSNTVTSSWKSTGTGFFIDKKGYITTNYHVIKNAKEIEINHNHKSYNAKVIISDEQNDLAILKIIDNSFIPLNSLNYNFKTDLADVGTSVFALGFPLTQIMGEEIKYTDGKISSKSGFKGSITTYQISVPIQPGNSGGPLFDESGNLVGITSSGINKTIADNANYAIKTKYLSMLVDEIDDHIELPKSSLNNSSTLQDKIKTLSNYVVYIKVK
ncbi:MAG: serine protease [Flavobacteriaceae bacterium]|jgi:V8-like Glu-specific endopeptidase|nr:serine protease [Flavobacteriaceae bacterium]